MATRRIPAGNSASEMPGVAAGCPVWQATDTPDRWAKNLRVRNRPGRAPGNGTLQYSGSDARYNIPLHSAGQAPLNPGRIIIADMDQDGFGDLVVTSNGYTVPNVNDSTSVVVVLINQFELVIGNP